MGRKAEEMGPLAVSRLKAPGMHFVGGVDGLALQVLPTGGRSWVLRVMIGGKRREMGLGGFPDVKLADAREAARIARRKIREGVDPIEESRAVKAALAAGQAKVVTFKEAAEQYVTAHEASWKNPKHRAQWRATLKAYAYPTLGSLSVRDIELPHVLAVLEPIWTEKSETASRLRGRIEVVMDWATAHGHRKGLNPARWRGHLDKILPRPSKVARVKHHAAIPVGAVGAFMQKLRQADGTGARALEFAALTAGRSGEVRGATWAEIDLKAKVWTIPAQRMKAGHEHRVPLSPAAIDILQRLPKFKDVEFVFPSARGGQLSDMTLLAVMRRLNAKAVPHGLRSTFRDWASERTSYAHEVAEMALAHTIGNKTEAAYRRGDLFEKRRRLMNDWAAFMDRIEEPAEIIPLRRQTSDEAE